jgi:hypothetical protein
VCVCARSDLFSRSIHTPKKRHKFNSHQSEIFTHTCVLAGWLDGWLAGWLVEDASVMAYFALEM